LGTDSFPISPPKHFGNNFVVVISYYSALALFVRTGEIINEHDIAIFMVSTQTLTSVKHEVEEVHAL